MNLVNQTVGAASANPQTNDTMSRAYTGHFVAYGHVVSTVTFETDGASNAFMLSSPGWSVIGIDGKGLIHVAENSDKGTPLEHVRRLLCCCCGAEFKGRQFANQDTGWGLGDCCVERVSAHVEDMERTYGISGIHYNVVSPNI